MTGTDITQATRIFYAANDQAGWAPVNHMVDLACRLLNARSCDLSMSRLPPLRRIHRTVLAPPRGGEGGDIFILRHPAELLNVLGHPGFGEKRAFRAVWIIDSFWTRALVKPVKRLLSYFDLVVYTRHGDGDFYKDLCADRAVWLGWGTDALDLGRSGGERPWDILRVGRQPPPWDDDARTEAACALRGLCFHGRPPFGSSPITQQRDLMQDWYANTKFLIAHSNLAAPAPYTHPEKDYITARWTDALACGAVVAGVQPAGDLTLIDWPEAMLNFDQVNLAENLGQIQEAHRSWTPKIAARNRLEALRRLDWRWRIAKLAQILQCGTETLKVELMRLDAEIAHQTNALDELVSKA